MILFIISLGLAIACLVVSLFAFYQYQDYLERAGLPSQGLTWLISLVLLISAIVLGIYAEFQNRR